MKRKISLLRTISWRIGIPLIFSFIILIIYYIITENSVEKITDTHMIELMMWNIVYSLVATLYAICVAFLLVKELQSFSDLKSSFKSEAYAFKSISMYLFYMVDDEHIENQQYKNQLIIVKNIQKYIRNYIILLINNDLSGSKNNLSEQDLEVNLWNCIQQVSKIKPIDENDRVALEKLMVKFEEVLRIRAIRTGWLDRGMSPYLFFFLVVLSIVIIIPFFTFVSVNSFVNYAAIATSAFFLMFLLVTLKDISNPFKGYWNIPIRPFTNLLENEFYCENQSD